MLESSGLFIPIGHQMVNANVYSSCSSACSCSLIHSDDQPVANFDFVCLQFGARQVAYSQRPAAAGNNLDESAETVKLWARKWKLWAERC